MKQKVMSIIAVILTATILGGCTAAPAANAEDLGGVPALGTQEVSIFEPDTAVLDSVPGTIVSDAGSETGVYLVKCGSQIYFTGKEDMSKDFRAFLEGIEEG